jgi:hypothetical protein
MAAAVLNPAATASKPVKLLLDAGKMLQQQQEAGNRWSESQQRELVKAVAAAEGVDPRAVAMYLSQTMVNVLWELLPVNWRVNNGLADVAMGAAATGGGRAVQAVAEAAAVEVWQLVVKDLLVCSSDEAVAKILGSFPRQRSWEAELAALRVAVALQLPESNMLQLVNAALERHKVVGGCAFLQLVLRDKDIPLTSAVVAAMLQQALDMLLPDLVNSEGGESDLGFDFDFDFGLGSGSGAGLESNISGSSSSSKGRSGSTKGGAVASADAPEATAVKSAVAVAKAAFLKDNSAAAFDFLMHVSNVIYMGGGSSRGVLNPQVEEQLLEGIAAAATAALTRTATITSGSTAVFPAVSGDADDLSTIRFALGSSDSSRSSSSQLSSSSATAVGGGGTGAAHAALLSSLPWLIRALLEHGCYSSCKDVAKAAASSCRRGMLLPPRPSKQVLQPGTATASSSSQVGESSSSSSSSADCCCSIYVFGQMLQQVVQWEGCTAAAGGEVRAVQHVMEAVAEGVFQGCSVEECLVVLGRLTPVLGAKVGRRVAGAAGGRLYSVRRQVDLILDGTE